MNDPFRRRVGRFLFRLFFRLRQRTDEEIEDFAKGIHNKKVLEIGSGISSTSRFFDSSNEFIRSDVRRELGHRFVDARSMVFVEEFDVVLCIGILEHVFDFWDVIPNIYRALKVGGHCLFFVPVFYPWHDEPKDFWRFSEHGLKLLFKDFEEVDLKVWGVREFPFGYFVRLKKNGREGEGRRSRT